jgi:hypothetical protein
VSSQTTGDRGHRGDPCYTAPRLLRRRADRFSHTATAN